MTYLPPLLLLIALLPALWFDLRQHRLPNWLTGTLLLLGLILNTVLYSWQGLLDALGGAVLGLLIFLPFYLYKKGMGAGDVKMMAAIGAMLGIDDGLFCAASVLIIGSLYGLLYLVYKGGLIVSLRRYWLSLLARTWLAPEANEAANLNFPYAVAIASGVVFTLHSQGELRLIANMLAS